MDIYLCYGLRESNMEKFDLVVLIMISTGRSPLTAMGIRARKSHCKDSRVLVTTAIQHIRKAAHWQVTFHSRH